MTLAALTPSRASGMVGGLRTLAALAAELGAAEIAADATALAERVSEGRVYVACLGQFKRGKSTLLNALLGDAILPTGVVPVTATVIIVRHGATLRVLVHHRLGSPVEVAANRVADYVTEAGNPRNAKDVAVVEIFHPSPLLETGVCLVDTPGVGSSSPLASDVTRAFVPQIDAALFVLGADPPVSGEEMALLQQVSQETSRLIFAINKADKLGDGEMAEVLVFTERVLAERLGAVPDGLFLVSAVERLRGGTPTRDWTRLEAALAALATDARTAVLLARVRSTSRRLAAQLTHTVDATAAALRGPLEATDRRLDALRRWCTQAEQALTEFSVLLAAEHRAIAQSVTDQTKAAQARVRTAALAELQTAVAAASKRQSKWSWSAVFPLAQDIARRAVHDELAELEVRTARAHEHGTRRFVLLANDFLTRLAATEPDLQQLPPIETHVELAGQRRFFFTELMTLTASTPWQFLADRFGTRTHVRARIAERAGAYLTRLLDTNTSRVVHDLDERLVESRRALDREIRARLTELVAAAERAASRAREIRTRGDAAVGPELERLSVIRSRLATVSLDENVSAEGPVMPDAFR